MCAVMGESGVNVLNGSIKELTFVQVSTIDGRTLQNTEIGSMLNTAAPTPEPFGSMADDGFYSKLVSCFFTFFTAWGPFFSLWHLNVISPKLCQYIALFIGSENLVLIPNNISLLIILLNSHCLYIQQYIRLFGEFTFGGFIHRTECIV